MTRSKRLSSASGFHRIIQLSLKAKIIHESSNSKKKIVSKTPDTLVLFGCLMHAMDSSFR